MNTHAHGSHSAVATRLKRAAGHLNTVIGMIEAGRPCVDLAQQLHAVEAAITAAKKALIHDHIEHCLDNAVNGGGQGDLSEFKEITKYL